MGSNCRALLSVCLSMGLNTLGLGVWGFIEVLAGFRVFRAFRVFSLQGF